MEMPLFVDVEYIVIQLDKNSKTTPRVNGTINPRSFNRGRIMSKYKFNKYILILNVKGRKYLFNFQMGQLFKISEKFFKFYNKNSHKSFTLDVLQAESSLNEEDIKTFKETFVIIPSDLEEMVIGKYIFDKMRRDRTKFFVTICPTLQCNFSCVYCFEKGRSQPYMKVSVADKIIKWIIRKVKRINYKEVQVSWYGGEPLLKIDIIGYIMEKLRNELPKNVSLKANIITNGSLLHPSNIKKLEANGVSQIQVTLDGDIEYHNRTRPFLGGKPSFNIVYKNLKHGVINFKGISWVLRINVYGENRDSIFNLLNRLVRDGLNNQDNLTIGFKSIFISPFNNNFELRTLDEKISKDILEFIKFLINKNFKSFPILPYYNICNFMTENTFVVDPEGYLYKCEETVGIKELSVGNIIENGEENLVFEKILKWFYYNPWHSADEFEHCKDCKLLPYCNGYCILPKVLNKGHVRCHEYKYIINDLVKLYITTKTLEGREQKI